MIAFLLDTDAYNFSRKLSLLGRLLAVSPTQVRLVLTGYIARHELSPLFDEIKEYESSEKLSIHDLERRGEANELFKSVRKDGIDKGESEAIAWLLLQDPGTRPIFISCDNKAVAVAKKRRLVAGDLLDLALVMIRAGLAPRDDVAAALVPWEEAGFGLGKPRDFESLAIAMKARDALSV